MCFVHRFTGPECMSTNTIIVTCNAVLSILVTFLTLLPCTKKTTGGFVPAALQASISKTWSKIDSVYKMIVYSLLLYCLVDLVHSDKHSWQWDYERSNWGIFPWERNSDWLGTIPCWTRPLPWPGPSPPPAWPCHQQPWPGSVWCRIRGWGCGWWGAGHVGTLHRHCHHVHCPHSGNNIVYIGILLTLHWHLQLTAN